MKEWPPNLAGKCRTTILKQRQQVAFACFKSFTLLYIMLKYATKCPNKNLCTFFMRLHRWTFKMFNVFFWNWNFLCIFLNFIQSSVHCKKEGSMSEQHIASRLLSCVIVTWLIIICFYLVLKFHKIFPWEKWILMCWQVYCYPIYLMR